MMMTDSTMFICDYKFRILETYWATLIENLTRVCTIGGTVEIIDTSAILCNAGSLGQEVNQ
jgi:hypothetical protein